jgi:hypothetical protein
MAPSEGGTGKFATRGRMLITFQFLSLRIINLFLIVCRISCIPYSSKFKRNQTDLLTAGQRAIRARNYSLDLVRWKLETSHFHIGTFDVEKCVLSCPRTSINTAQRSSGTLFSTFGTLLHMIFAFNDENMRKSRNDVPPLRNRIAAREGTIITVAHAHFQNLLSK